MTLPDGDASYRWTWHPNRFGSLRSKAEFFMSQPQSTSLDSNQKRKTPVQVILLERLISCYLP
ncbi:hypothetical protein [Agrobacterium sp. NPDC090283]|uniref:hypothetical protein n=1 Tax=Agrobacterium sp. NPDC090283 TaxID=3363920 RepID=UPI00383B91E6